MRRWIWIIFILIVTAGIFFVFSRPRSSSNAAATTATHTITPRRGNLLVTITAPGNLQTNSAATANVAALQPGMLTYIASAGNSVKAGGVVARFNQTDLKTSLLQAENTRAVAQAQQAKGQTSTALQIANQASALAAQHQSLASAKSVYNLAKSRVDADESLLTSDAVTHQQADSDKNGLVQAESAYTQAQSAVAAAQGQLTSLKRQQSDALRLDILSIEKAKLQLNTAQQALARSVLRSPISGTVISVSKAVGDYVGTGASLLVVSDLNRIQMSAQVAETNAAQVKIGQLATLTLTGFPNQAFSGKVVSVYPETLVQNNVAYLPITIRLDSHRADLKPGMSATAEITVQKVDNALLLPVSAFTRIQGNRGVVRVLRDDKEEMAPVRIGATSSKDVQILDGLSANSEVVAGGKATANGSFNNRNRGGFRPPF